MSIYREWMLPAREFHNLWDSLLYEEDIKSRLLHYAITVSASCAAGHTLLFWASWDVPPGYAISHCWPRAGAAIRGAGSEQPSGVLQPHSAAARPAGHWQDHALQGPGPEAGRALQPQVPAPSLAACEALAMQHAVCGSAAALKCCACAAGVRRFWHGQLIEVNAHSLFSKWFSESGKLVSRLFAKITGAGAPVPHTHLPRYMHAPCSSAALHVALPCPADLRCLASAQLQACNAPFCGLEHGCACVKCAGVRAVAVSSMWSACMHACMHACMGLQVEEQDSLVCVLLDEVESLTRARSAAVSGSEPADAIRAVNALLTQAWPWGYRGSVAGRRCHMSTRCSCRCGT